LESDSAVFGLYSVWARQGWHVEGLAAYVRSEYDIDRNVLGTRATGETSGNMVVAALSGGYDFQAGGWKFGPTGGGQYAYGVIDSYTQQGGLGALSVGENTIQSFQSILGVQGSREFDWGFLKLTPQLTAAWHHEFMNDSNDASTSFVNAPALGTFSVDGREPERDFALLGANFSAVIPGMNLVTFFAGYDAQVGQDSYIAHSVNGGLKASF
jgi:outer membrane autotransporter protein